MNAASLPQSAFEDDAPRHGLRPSAKIRVGVLADSMRAPKWAAHVLEELVRSDFAELVLLVIDKRGRRNENGVVWDSLFFRLWNKLDRQLNARDGDAFSGCDLTALLKDVPVIEIGASKPLSENLESLRAVNLDVLFALDGQPSTNEMSAAAKYGIWGMFESGEHSRFATAGFWAAYRGHKVVRKELRVLTPAQDVQTLFRSYSATNDVSPYLGQASSSWKMADVVLRRLAELKRYGWDHVRTLHKPQTELSSAPAPALALPGNGETAWFFARWLADAARYEFNYRLRKEQWFIAYRENNGAIPISTLDMADFRVITPPRDRFYADPFVVERNGKHYVFFEDYRCKLRKGLISFVEIDQCGQTGKPEVVLDRPYHLSYPNVFQWGGEWFMLPETRANRAVELYRAVEFPRRWVLEKVLLKDAPAVDPTVIEHEGRLWMFVGGMVDDASPNDELFLFSAQSLCGQWSSHPKNPVVSDVRKARPAGQIFIHKGQLVRPSQDCSTRYGHAISFNRIETLSPDDYVETPIGRVSPEWRRGNLGTHTFNQSDRFQVVDGRVLIFK